MRRRRGASGFGAVVLVLAAAVVLPAPYETIAAAVARPAGPSKASALAPRLNPTGRTLSLIVDLRDGDRHLGEVAVQIAPDDTISVHKEQLANASAALLRPQFAQRLLALTAQTGFITLAALNEAGFRYSFDPGAMQVQFAPAIEQRPRGEVNLGPRGARHARTSAQPAPVSGYLNIRAATDYVGTSFVGDTGLAAPRADFEGVLRWQDVVLEAEAAFDGTRSDLTGKGHADDGSGHGFSRRSTRLVYDLPDDALRLQVGDINPAVTSLQRGSDLLGVSVERSLRKLRPGENIRPTGKRSFRIARPSTVKIELNGVVMRQLRLDPGEYDLDDLPLRGGANQIRLIITDDVGEQRTLDFTSYFDAALLGEGIAEWGLAAGVLSEFDLYGLSYNFDQPIATGFYREGLSPELTGEAHFQAGSGVAMMGASLYSASALGFLAVEAGVSFHDTQGAGAALEIDWDVLRAQADDASLFLSAALRSPDFARPGTHDQFEDYWLTLLASYSRALPYDIHASLSARYSFASEHTHHDTRTEDLYGVALGLSTSLSHALGLALSISYSTDTLPTFTSPDLERGDDGDLRAALRLTWRPDADTHIAATFEAGEPAAGISASHTWRDGVSTWRTSIETVYDDKAGEVAADASLHYRGNRLTASLTHTASLDARAFSRSGDRLTDQRTTLQFGTSIAFADQHVAVGPPITGPGGFAIIAPHESLSGNRIVLGGSARPRAHTDALGPALVTGLPSYQATRLGYDVVDLPLGYDIGNREFHLKAPYKGGYALTVGSVHSVSAFGTLIGTDGGPVALLTGTAQPEGFDAPPVMLFTNGAGRFGAQGLSPGRWRIEMASAPPQHFVLEIPQGTNGLFRAGKLHAAQPGEDP